METEIVIGLLNPKLGGMECRGCGYDHWAFLEGEALAADDFGKPNRETRSVSLEARKMHRKAAQRKRFNFNHLNGSVLPFSKFLEGGLRHGNW